MPWMTRDETVDLHKRKIKFSSDCQGIITISDCTSNDYLDCKLIAPDKRKWQKIKRIYCGVERFSDEGINLGRINEILKSKGYGAIKEKGYLLYYGTIEPRKNLTALIKAFEELKAEHEIDKGYKLVIMGGRGWGNIHQMIEDHIKEEFPIKKDSDVILVDFMTDKYLSTLIQNAQCLAYPSFYEGFGLPIVESMQYGTPVICSKTSSMPEVGGEACQYIDPYDLNSIKAGIKLIVNNSKLRRELAEKSIRRSRLFSWEKCAQETYDFYQSLVQTV